MTARPFTTNGAGAGQRLLDQLTAWVDRIVASGADAAKADAIVQEARDAGHGADLLAWMRRLYGIGTESQLLEAEQQLNAAIVGAEFAGRVQAGRTFEDAFSSTFVDARRSGFHVVDGGRDS